MFSAFIYPQTRQDAWKFAQAREAIALGVPSYSISYYEKKKTETYVKNS